MRSLISPRANNWCPLFAEQRRSSLSKGRLVATFLSFRLSPTKSGARRNLSTKQEIMNRFLHSLSLGRNDVSNLRNDISNTKMQKSMSDSKKIYL